MHAILASLGTDGDILPFLGLAATLRARGHRVTFAAAENYSDLIAAHHLEFHSLASAEKMRALLAHTDFWHPIKTARFTAAWGNSLIEPQYQLIKSLAADPGTVLVTNPAVLGAMLVHETLHRPLAHIILQPWLIHSRSAPSLMPVGLPPWAPRIMHGLFYSLIDIAAATLIGPAYNPLRRSLGLKPIHRVFNHWFSKKLIIGFFPEWFGPPQSDWPSQVRLAGFPRFDGVLDRTPPRGLPEFLASPKPTVVFTFGSGMMHPGRLAELASHVSKALDCQIVFISRFFKPQTLPPQIFHADFVPFRDLFPRCAAVVHHGGIGTMAEAFAAGTPQLVIPLGFDQLDNGARAQAAGAGLHTRPMHHLICDKPLPQRDVDDVVAALRMVLTPEARCSARVLSEKLKANDALEKAADLLEALR